MESKVTSLPEGVTAPELAYLRFRESERIGDNRRVLVVDIDAPLNSRASGFENHSMVFSGSMPAATTGFSTPDFIIIFGSCRGTDSQNIKLKTLYLTLKATFPEALILHDINIGETLSLGIKAYENRHRQMQQKMLRRLSDKGIKEIIQEAFDNEFTNEFGHLFRKLFESFAAGKTGDGRMFITPGDFLNEANSLSSSIIDSKYRKGKI